MAFRQKNHWGTFLWGYIHTITIIDFDDSIEMSNQCIHILKQIIFPCKKCHAFYTENLYELENIDKEPMSLFKWSWNLHNKVNQKLNKPIISYEEALSLWTTKIECR